MIIISILNKIVPYFSVQSVARNMVGFTMIYIFFFFVLSINVQKTCPPEILFRSKIANRDFLVAFCTRLVHWGGGHFMIFLNNREKPEYLRKITDFFFLILKWLHSKRSQTFETLWRFFELCFSYFKLSSFFLAFIRLLWITFFWLFKNVYITQVVLMAIQVY